MILELKSTVQVKIKNNFLRGSPAGWAAFSGSDKRNDQSICSALSAQQKTVAGDPDECEYFRVEHASRVSVVARLRDHELSFIATNS
jgi:hypothetical protein